MRLVAWLIAALIAGTATASVPPSNPNELWIRGEIFPFSLNYISQRMRNAKPKQRFIIHINTQGGDLGATLNLMQDIIQASQRGVFIRCEAEALAASGGFFILQSCPLRIAKYDSLLMAHEAHFVGKKNPTPKEAEQLDGVNEELAKFVAMRIDMPLTIYKAHVHNKDWWMNAYTALRAGAIDGIKGGGYKIKECHAPTTH